MIKKLKLWWAKVRLASARSEYEDALAELKQAEYKVASKATAHSNVHNRLLEMQKQ